MNLKDNNVEYKVKVDYEYKMAGESFSGMVPRLKSYLPYIEPAKRKLVIERFNKIYDEITTDD